MQSGKSGFRTLLRTVKVVFQNDDFAIKSARIKLREEFSKNKNVTDPKELQELFKGVKEVDELLRFNIVQGKRNNKGNYEVKFREENQVTVGAHQHLPLGVELEPIDQSLSGKPVTIQKSGGKKIN